MRLIGMLNPFALAGSEIASPAQVAATLRELYSSKPHVVATCGIALAGLSAASSGAVRAGAVATIVTAACLFLRIVLEYLYCKHASVPVHQRWVSLFVFGSLACGLGWGVSGAVLLYGASAATQTITVGVACAIVQGAAGRAFMMPGTAFINIALVLGLMAIAAYLDGNYVIIPACILYYCFLSSFIVQMVGNRMRQLRAEEMNERLLEPQSVSIGLVSCAVGPGISREMILAAADAALYAAKQQGRNCICIGSNEGLATSIAT